MHLRYWKPAEPNIGNFGDEINPWLWPKEMPGLFDEDDGIAFYSIGTLLGYPKANNEDISKKIVFGSGAGFPEAGDAEQLDDSWDIYFVRGPLTTKAMHLDKKLALTDPAILIANYFERGASIYSAGFMPHIHQAMKWDGILREACQRENILYIDPRETVESATKKIGSVDVMICEAMHAAIVADAVRVPWIPVHTTLKPHTFKWTDWCSAIKVEFNSLWLCNGSEILRRTGLEILNINEVSIRILQNRLKKIVARTTPCLSDDNLHRQLLTEVTSQVSRLCSDHGVNNPHSASSNSSNFKQTTT